MRLTMVLSLRRGWAQPPKYKEPPESYNLIRHGKIKWRDFQPREMDPPYWYKWTTDSPYTPKEQTKILKGETISWYKENYDKLKVVQPDEWLYKVGDKVEILVGKDIGKQGTITQVIPEGNVIVIGGLNCKRSLEENILQQIEQPLQHDEVSLLDPITKETTTVSFKVNMDGQRVRVSDQSGHIIPWPDEVLSDGTLKRLYVFGEKDTSFIDANERTYQPTLASWEDQLGKIFNVNDPPRKETFWY